MLLEYSFFISTIYRNPPCSLKKAIDFLTTALHVHHAFFNISFPPLHDFDMKVPFCEGRNVMHYRLNERK